MSFVIIGPNGEIDINQSNRDGEDNERDGERNNEIPEYEPLPGLEIITPTQPQKEKAPLIFPMNSPPVKPRINEILGNN